MKREVGNERDRNPLALGTSGMAVINEVPLMTVGVDLGSFRTLCHPMLVKWAGVPDACFPVGRSLI